MSRLKNSCCEAPVRPRLQLAGISDLHSNGSANTFDASQRERETEVQCREFGFRLIWKRFFKFSYMYANKVFVDLEHNVKKKQATDFGTLLMTGFNEGGGRQATSPEGAE